MAYEGSEKLLARTQNFVDDHRAQYLASGGSQGHIVDMSHAGAPGMAPTLLLKTTGRKSGKTQISPLIYGIYGREWVVVGSKGGAPEHPAWYLNLKEMTETEFQVGTQAFKTKWREAEGEERQKIWDYIGQVYPPYADYSGGAGDRVIPVILLRPTEEVAVFTAPSAA